MRKKLYTNDQLNELRKNPNVLEATEQTLTYHPDFKVMAVLESIEGISPLEIFKESGFDLEIIGKDIPRKRLYNWRKIYDKSGELGLRVDYRGKTQEKNSTDSLSAEEKLKKAEAKIKLLETENEFLKKLEMLERQAMRKKRN